MSFHNWHSFQRRRFIFKGGLSSRMSLYLSTGLRDVGLGAVNVFVPIYLYKVLGNIVSVFLVMSIYHAMVLLTVYGVAKIIRKIGLDMAGFIGGLLRGVFFYLLIIGESNPAWLWWAGVCWGLVIGFTWLTHHYYLVAAEKEVKFGKQVARFIMIDRWLISLMPLVGSMIIEFGGYRLMNMIAMGFFSISGLPLFFDRFNAKKMKMDWQDTVNKKWLLSHKRMAVAFMGLGIKSEVVGTVWPIYLFLIVKDYLKVGIIQAASLVLASIILVWLSKQVDGGNRKMMRPALTFNSLNLLVRGLVATGLGLFVLESLYRLVASFVWVPFESQIYESAIKERRMEFFVRREWLVHGGGLVASLFFGLVFSLGLSWNLAFGIGALGLALVGVVRPNEE